MRTTLHAAVGVVLILCVTGFMALADGVISHEFDEFDVAFLAALQAETPRVWLWAASYLTWLGNGYVVVPVTLIVAVVICIKVDLPLALLWYGSQAGAWALNYAMKGLFGRTRPLEIAAIGEISGFHHRRSLAPSTRGSPARGLCALGWPRRGETRRRDPSGDFAKNGATRN